MHVIVVVFVISHIISLYQGGVVVPGEMEGLEGEDMEEEGRGMPEIQNQSVSPNLPQNAPEIEKCLYYCTLHPT
jgi:hypothetical protein